MTQCRFYSIHEDAAVPENGTAGVSQRDAEVLNADMVESYIVVLNSSDEKVAGKIYNAGYENQPVRELAETVRGVIGDDVKLVTTPTDDNRSYHISSEKIYKELGFKARHTIRDAVVDLVQAFEAGKIPDSLNDETYFNIRRMQSLKLA